MEEKENVYEGISTAGQVEEEKSLLGKFKDVDALMQAYNSLQAEFTRRSQRLKELERAGKSAEEKEVLCQGTDNPPEGQEGEHGFGKDAEPDTQGQEECLTATAKDGTEAESGGTEDTVGRSDEKIMDGGAKTALTAEELYRLASKEEGVRLQIVGDYLQSLQKKGAPISKGGVGALLSPPKKAQSIREAGNLAFRMFQDAGKNQF